MDYWFQIFFGNNIMVYIHMFFWKLLYHLFYDIKLNLFLFEF